MILLIDADSLAFSSCYRRKENPDDYPYFENFEDVAAKFDEVFMKIINDIEELYEITDFYVFNNSKGNFRKRISKTYKANRLKADLPPFLNEIHEFIRDNYNGKMGYGYETDDLVASYWKMLSDTVGRDNVMIVSIDKDYKQFPALIYNYHANHKCVYDINEWEAMYNFYEQMIVGDGADNVNFCKGYGKKYAEKLLSDATSNYQMTKRVYELYRKIHKGKAKLRYIECYTMLKLKIDVI
jgi:5'-3' exonuclease